MRNMKIKIKARTWRRDSYGLFDYESAEINKQEITIQNSGLLIREANDIKFVKEINPASREVEPLFTIVENERKIK
jgi:hypothetical protein